MPRPGYVYILTNRGNQVLYTGITNNLKRRVYEHKTKRNKGLTQRYNVDKLVYYETFTSIRIAIAREKQIKAGSRRKKLKLVNRLNPDWRDLYTDLL